MKSMLFAGALALAVVGLLPGMTGHSRASEAMVSESSSTARIDISRIKYVLRLTPEQHAYWPAVESALRSLARHQPAPEDAGLVRRVSNRVKSFVLDGAAIARIGIAVRPLVKVLDDRQKQDAVALIHEMGLTPILTALN